MPQRKKAVKRTTKKAPVRRKRQTLATLPARSTVARRPSYSAAGYAARAAIGQVGGRMAARGLGFLADRIIRNATGLFSKAGGAIGGMLGGPAGALAGAGAGYAARTGVNALWKAVSGYGDYKVENNTILDGGMSPPQIVNSVADGGVIVRHREYLGDINATINFTIDNYPLNPGMEKTFPWLSSIANSFEEYKWRGMIFEFKSESSDSILSTATSSALGSVMMATQYNALSPAFPDKRQMENYEFATASKPSCSFIHPIECKGSVTPLTKLYVRNGAPPPNADLRLFDLGNFYIATQGMQAASGVCGELWCSYEVELYKPKSQISGGPDSNMDHFQISAPTNAAPWTGGVLTSASNIGGTIGGNTYTFPSTTVDGLYMMVWQQRGSGGVTITAPSLAVAGGVTVPFSRNNLDAFVTTPQDGVTLSTRFAMTTWVRISAPSAVITLGAGGTLPGTATGDLYIMEIPFTMNFVDGVDPDEESEEEVTPRKSVPYDSGDEAHLTSALAKMNSEEKDALIALLMRK